MHQINQQFFRKYSASTPSSPDPACSHMTQYSSQAGLNELGVLSKHLQVIKTGHSWATSRMFTFFRQLLLYFLLFIVMLASPKTPEAEETTPSHSSKEYNLSVFPFLAQSALEGIFAPLAAELSEALSCKIHYQSAAGFESFMANLERQQYDIAHIQPFDYVGIAVKAGYIPIVTRTEMLPAVFVVKKESPLRRAQDLRGKKIGLPPKVAAVSYLGQVAMLEAGIQPGEDVSLHHFNTHQTCLQKLLIGDIDVCVSGRPVMRIFETKTGRPLRIILTSPEIPQTLFVVHERVPPADRKRIQETLLATRMNGVDPSLRKLFTPAAGEAGAYFRVVKDQEYDVVRRYLKMITDQ